MLPLNYKNLIGSERFIWMHWYKWQRDDLRVDIFELISLRLSIPFSLAGFPLLKLDLTFILVTEFPFGLLIQVSIFGDLYCWLDRYSDLVLEDS